MLLNKFKECLEPVSGEKISFEGWFYNAETQFPFDSPFMYENDKKCLEEIHQIWSKTGDLYYWFAQKGELVSDGGSDTISASAIKINKTKLRDYKLSLLGL